jgi:hypothetical protein
MMSFSLTVLFWSLDHCQPPLPLTSGHNEPQLVGFGGDRSNGEVAIKPLVDQAGYFLGRQAATVARHVDPWSMYEARPMRAWSVSIRCPLLSWSCRGAGGLSGFGPGLPERAAEALAANVSELDLWILVGLPEDRPCPPHKGRGRFWT